MVPRVRPLIYNGYKNNAQKVLSFIVTDNSWRTYAGLPHLFHYSDHFSTVVILFVASNLVMYKFFGLFLRLTPTTN